MEYMRKYQTGDLSEPMVNWAWSVMGDNLDSHFVVGIPTTRDLENSMANESNIT